MQILLIIIVGLVVGGFAYTLHPRFGANATGERLVRMKSKPNYKDGAFDNLEYTPARAEGVSFIDMLIGFFFTKKVRNTPQDKIPAIKTDLKKLPSTDSYIWFGHSSYLLQLDGKKILIDPVFSKYASPVRYSIPAFEATYNYQSADIPDVDIMVITHDHWDHLDYNTFHQIKDRVKHIITSLGVGAHLEKWGYPANQITELYWGEDVQIDGLSFTSTPARHFSGRTLRRNVTLWSSFVLKSKSKNIFIGSDSGYGKHFKEIGAKFGPFDYAILENGQYNEMWKYIHMMPEEVILASHDLGAKVSIPVHSSKFPLANHPWDESLIRVSKAAKEAHLPILTPIIGQIVSLDKPTPTPAWWEGLN